MKITMRYQYIPIRITEIRNIDNKSPEKVQPLKLSYTIKGMQNGTATQEKQFVSYLKI